jgi:hypothetical protein
MPVFTFKINQRGLTKGSDKCILWALTKWSKETNNYIRFYRLPENGKANICFGAGKPPDKSQAFHYDLGNGVHSIIFDPSLSWATTGWHRFIRRLPDMERMALHEIGHALGIIDHSDDPDSIMYFKPTTKKIDKESVRLAKLKN